MRTYTVVVIMMFVTLIVGCADPSENAEAKLMFCAETSSDEPMYIHYKIHGIAIATKDIQNRTEYGLCSDYIKLNTPDEGDMTLVMLNTVNHKGVSFNIITNTLGDVNIIEVPAENKQHYFIFSKNASVSVVDF